MQLSKHIFWDIDLKSIDYNKHISLIIERVFIYGNLEDWKIIKQHYGVEKIKVEALKIRVLDKKTLSFLSLLFNEPIQNFRCYKQIQLTNAHWNY